MRSGADQKPLASEDGLDVAQFMTVGNEERREDGMTNFLSQEEFLF